MLAAPFLRLPSGRAILIALLVVLILAFSLTPAAAASVNETAAISAPANIVVADFLGETVGNRTRMIQLACILGAIGIFILTRTIR